MRFSSHWVSPIVWVKQLSFAALYILSATLSLHIDSAPESNVLMWIPTGLLLGALIRSRLALLPGAVMGEVTSNVIKFGPLSLMGYADCVGDLVVGCVIAAGLSRVLGSPLRLNRFKHLFFFLVFVGTALPISATYDALMSAVTGHRLWSQIPRMWCLCISADSLGIMLLTPLICSAPRWPLPTSVSTRSIAWAVGLFALLAVTTYLGLFLLGNSVRAPVYLVFPAAAIIAVQFGTFGAALASSTTTLMAALGTILGASPFVGPHVNDVVYSTAAFSVVLSLFSLLVAAAISELRRANTRYQVANEEAESSVRATNIFLSKMSHELRTPLNAIVGGSALLVAQPLDPPHARTADLVHSAGEHLRGLVDDLFELSRFDATDTPLQSVPFNLRVAITDAVAIAAPPQSRGRSPHVELDIEPTCSVWVNGDVRRFRQILINLVGNALRFTTEGRVTVACSVQPEGNVVRVRCEVRDTGIGISPDDQAIIFEPFQQGRSNRRATEKSQGTGLGLRPSPVI